MISVLLYGRNDSHGYNLQKRAALSLNCIAAVLTDLDDEIIFVDYNTPDELPTFPEAIEDCLTRQARDRLRVIRVRPNWHAPLSAKTRLVALEPQSRNIAVRRANPANPWILSTNTDMIFLPENPERSLTQAVAGLDEGYYHLPRIELPEGFWERQSRNNPEGFIGNVANNYRRFHLDEVIYGAYDNIYEAPGDFQLFRREDLWAIGGFDERMILGWHVDANISRRMRLLRGEVRTASAVVRGFHCGHSRQPTPLHAENRTQNDMRQFIELVSDPVCKFQLDTWGAPEATFEELRLNGSINARYIAAMRAALPRPQASDYVFHYNAGSFGAPVLHPEHTLAHVCDFFFNLQDGLKIFATASDLTFLNGFRKFLAEAQPRSTLLLVDEGASPPKAALPTKIWSKMWRTLETAIEEADVFLVQYPSSDLADPDGLRDLQWWAQSVFHRIVDVELDREPHRRRRIVTVNAVHSAMEKTVVTSISHAAAPFTTRLRQGFVQDRLDRRKVLDRRQSVFDATDRLHPYSETERELLRNVVGTVVRRRPSTDGWRRLAPELLALAEHPDAAERILGHRLTEREALKESALEAIELGKRRAVGPITPVPARPDTLTRLISGADWESASWLAFAARFFAQEYLYDLTYRSRWIWERVSLTLNARKLMDPRPRPWILVVAPKPDVLALLLANAGYKVAYATLDEFMGDRPAAQPDWVAPASASGIRVVTPSDLRPIEELAKLKNLKGLFAGLITPIGVIFEQGAARADAFLSKVHPLMSENAVLACAAHVHLNNSIDGGALSYAEWCNLFAEFGPLGARGFIPIEPPDIRVPLDTAVRFAFEDKRGKTIDGLSFGFLDGFVAPAVLAARWPKELHPGVSRETAAAKLNGVLKETDPAPAESPTKLDAYKANGLKADTLPKADPDASKPRKTLIDSHVRVVKPERTMAAEGKSRNKAKTPAKISGQTPSKPLPESAKFMPLPASPELDLQAGPRPNILPFIVSGGPLRRSPVGVQIAGSPAAVFALNICANDATCLRFKIKLDATIETVSWRGIDGVSATVNVARLNDETTVEIVSTTALRGGTLVFNCGSEAVTIHRFVIC